MLFHTEELLPYFKIDCLYRGSFTDVDFKHDKNNPKRALSGVAQWTEHHPRKLKVCQFDFKVRAPAWVEGQVPGWGHVRGN